MTDAEIPQSSETNGRRAEVSLPAPLSSEKPNSAQRNAMQQYQRAQVETASPTRLVVMLYDGAIRFCTLAQDAMRKRDLEVQNTNLIKAQRIIGELMSSLNRDAGGAIASNLFRIYTHLLEEMVSANLYDKADALDHVLSVLREMREGWEEIDSIMSQDSKSKTSEASLPESGLNNSLLPAPAVSAQQRLMTKTARLLAAQRPAEGASLPSRLGDRNA